MNPLPQEGGRGIGRNSMICERGGEVVGAVLWDSVRFQEDALSPGIATLAGPFLGKGLKAYTRTLSNLSHVSRETF